MAKELSLRPYNGRLFVATSRKDYERLCKRLFGEPEVLSCNMEGRFGAGCGKDGNWIYLIYAERPDTMAHELSHVVLEVFRRVGIDPREAGGEPFCYMLQALMREAMPDTPPGSPGLAP